MQQLIVALLVIGAALVSAWKLMPARRRLALLVAFDAALRRRHWLTPWRQRVLARRIQAAAGAGCAGCAANPRAMPPRSTSRREPE
jgi:hypothetical protein